MCAMTWGMNFKSSMCGKKSLKHGLTVHFLSYYARANQENNAPVVAGIYKGPWEKSNFPFTFQLSDVDCFQCLNIKINIKM